MRSLFIYIMLFFFKKRTYSITFYAPLAKNIQILKAKILLKNTFFAVDIETEVFCSGCDALYFTHTRTK